MKKLNPFSEISILGLIFELVLISFVLFSLGYIANTTDPLLINSRVNILLILLSVVTLFYGLFSGLIVIVLIGAGFYYFYKPFPYGHFINDLLFMLIFSEFHYFWNKTLSKLQKENGYIKTRMEELSRNFYTLKLSHDQMEKSYIVKPNSLRNILSQIKNMYIQNPSGAYEELLTVIVKNYSVRKASIFLYKNGKFERVARYSTESDLNEDSRVFNDAIEKKSPSYLSNFHDIKKDYLAVLPAYDSDENLNLVMVIEDMQFLQFNKDNILSIWVILNYFCDFLHGVSSARELIDRYPDCPVDVLLEIKRLAYIRKKLDLKSLILMITIKNSMTEIEGITSLISRQLRGIEVMCTYNNMIFIIFPLVSYAHIPPVMEKVITQVSSQFTISSEDFSYKVLEILSNAKQTIDYIIAIRDKENESC